MTVDCKNESVICFVRGWFCFASGERSGLSNGFMFLKKVQIQLQQLSSGGSDQNFRSVVWIHSGNKKNTSVAQ